MNYSGLGLAIVKKLVDLHAGQIGIESILNKGTAVDVELKLRRYETQELNTVADSKPNIRVCVISTRAERASMFRSMCQSGGYSDVSVHESYNLLVDSGVNSNYPAPSEQLIVLEDADLLHAVGDISLTLQRLSNMKYKRTAVVRLQSPGGPNNHDSVDDLRIRTTMSPNLVADRQLTTNQPAMPAMIDSKHRTSSARQMHTHIDAIQVWIADAPISRVDLLELIQNLSSLRDTHDRNTSDTAVADTPLLPQNPHGRTNHGLDSTPQIDVSANTSSRVSTKINAVSHLYPLTILLVEDNRINQKMMTMTMKKLGYGLTIVANGLEALDHCTTHNPDSHLFQLVLMDVSMDVMDGLETTRRIRLHEKMCDAQCRHFIVGQTASVTLRAECLESGMDAFITKPISITELTTAIGQAYHFHNTPLTE